MTKQTSEVIGIALIAGLLGSLSGCKCPEHSAKGAPRITHQPEGQIVFRGTNASFSVEARNVGKHKGESLWYQWTRNGVEIGGATAPNLIIGSVEISNVAMYAVIVSNETAKIESKSAPLSMLDTNRGPDSGTLTCPIGDFTKSGGCCGKTFDKYNVYLPFDGPNASPVSVPFPNPNNRTNLEVDTFSDANPTVDTCVMIQQSFVPYGVLACNDDSTPPPPIVNHKLSTCTAKIATNKKYRVGICFQSSTLGGATTVTFNWLYHN